MNKSIISAKAFWSSYSDPVEDGVAYAVSDETDKALDPSDRAYVGAAGKVAVREVKAARVKARVKAAREANAARTKVADAAAAAKAEVAAREAAVQEGSIVYRKSKDGLYLLVV